MKTKFVWSTLLATSLSSPLLLGLTATARASTNPSGNWPGVIDVGKILATPTGVRTPLGFGTVIAKAQLDNTGGLKSIKYVNGVGWSLGDFDFFEYPLITTDHGKTWRVGGHWFAYPGNDGAAFASAIKPFHPRNIGGAPTSIASYFVGENTLYVTWNGGHQWHTTFMPGNIVSVTQLESGTVPETPSQYIQVKVRSFTKPSVVGYYISQDQGRRWTFSKLQTVLG